MKKLLYVITLALGASFLLYIEARKSTALYEIVIANNTKLPLHWHMKTTGNDHNGDIEPGDAYAFNTSNFLQRLTITFKKGKKMQRRGYPVAGLQSGKDWIFGVSGHPFEEPWSVCGSWAHTGIQHEATLAAEIIGLTAGTAALTAGGVVAGAFVAPVAGAGIGAVTIIGGGAIGASAAAGGIIELTKGKHLGLSRTMHKDTCKWYGK